VSPVEDTAVYGFRYCIDEDEEDDQPRSRVGRGGES
jgi:hypothetical protein